jgi:hypothetical protein
VKRTQIKRSPMKRSAQSVAKMRAFAKGLDDATPALVERAGGKCEARIILVCGRNERIAHRHHKLPRSHGGTNDLDNLLYVCDACHNWIHGHPAEAYKLGLLRRSKSDPNYGPMSTVRRTNDRTTL